MLPAASTVKTNVDIRSRSAVRGSAGVRIECMAARDAGVAGSSSRIVLDAASGRSDPAELVPLDLIRSRVYADHLVLPTVRVRIPTTAPIERAIPGRARKTGHAERTPPCSSPFNI